MVVSITLLIFAALVLAALSDVEEYADDNGGRLNVNPDITYLDGGSGAPFSAEGSRGAAGFLTFICCAGIVYHSVSIMVRVYYIRAGTQKLMCLYLILVNSLIVLFGICFFAGGVANLIFFVDNNSLSRDCTPDFAGRELCQDLERLALFQLISFGFSISAIVVYCFLWFPTCFATCRKIQDDGDNFFAPHFVSTTDAPPRVQANTPSSVSTTGAPPHVQANMPSSASTNGVPSMSKYASPSVSKDLPSHTSTGPPAYAYAAPPSYEAAIADTVE